MQSCLYLIADCGFYGYSIPRSSSFYLSLIVNLNATVSLIFGIAYFSLLGINYHVIGSQRDRKSNSFPRNVSEVNYFYFCFCLQFNADTYNKMQFRVIPQTPNFRLFFSSSNWSENRNMCKHPEMSFVLELFM